MWPTRCFEQTYEYLSEDGSVSDECVAGRAAFRPKGPVGKLAFWMTANKEPSAASLEAVQELEEGRGQRFDTVDALFEDLGI